MKKYSITVIVIFLAAFMSFYCFAINPMKKHHKGYQHEGVKDENIKLSGKIENGIRIIEIKASRYKFQPGHIAVRLGDKVRLVVTAADVAHGIAISEFNVKLSVPAGNTGNIEFVANKRGTFHAHCSVNCGPGHGDMHASFIVE